MKRVFLACIILFIFLPSAAAADKLEKYTQAAEAQQKAQIKWKLSGLGKLSGDIILSPNHKLLLPLGSKLTCVDFQGNMVWETKASSSGKMGQPILAENNLIYTASSTSLQEIKLNGQNNWKFSVYAGTKGSKMPMLAGGFDNLLYLPLPNALYGVNLSGRYIWMMSPWDSSETYSTKIIVKREFMACAADKDNFYVVYGKKKGYRLAAISNEGRFLWTYWLGDITNASFLPGNDGEIFVTVDFNKSSSGSGKSKLKTAKVYRFNVSRGSTPEWQYTLKTETPLSKPVLYDKILYFTGNHKIFALNADEGTLIWENHLLDLVSPPVFDPQTERIYAGSSEGTIYAVNQAGRMAWSRRLDGSIDLAPLIGPDGFLYVATEKGSLYKIKDSLK
ncbi:MAG: PQQ-binding-like beta-propeller repeat protein [Syntrophomonas sp.]|nr:PQQ-binding-like beta-propeller repeat protein [Syntrophomonas sp.]